MKKIRNSKDFKGVSKKVHPYVHGYFLREFVKRYSII